MRFGEKTTKLSAKPGEAARLNAELEFENL
jgi:hypothetical protein